MDYDQTDIAQRYKAARTLPGKTLREWLEPVRARAPACSLAIDLACGTGRFTAALAIDLFLFRAN